MYKYKKTREKYETEIDIIEMQKELMDETYKIISDSFEFQFVDQVAFEQIVFLIVCYHKFELNNEELEEIVMVMDIDEDRFLDTIQELFFIHEKPIPDSLLNVIEDLSKIL